MWNNKQIEYLKEKYHDTDNKILSIYFDKHIGTIIAKANIIGLKKDKLFMTELKKKNNPGTIWTENEINFLKTNYRYTSCTELANILNKTTKSVSKKLKKLKLKSDRISIIIKNNKNRGRNLSYENVKNISLKYQTRGEFYISDPSAYAVAIKNKWIDDLCKHMIIKCFSIPQLILKDILEHILKEKCSYNDKKIIKPFEIDCYFDKWKIGWEYDGKYFHKTPNYKKINRCQYNNILLLIINEKGPNYRKYEKNIKQQLIKQLDKINIRTSSDIKEDDINNYIPKIIYPNLLTECEKKLVYGKSAKFIRSTHKSIFDKIKKYQLYDSLNIINDIKSNTKRIETFEEYLKYLKNKNIVSYSTLLKTNEHPHRIMRRLKIPIQKLKNCLI